jgi:hypothetical protein
MHHWCDLALLDIIVVHLPTALEQERSWEKWCNVQRQNSWHWGKLCEEAS